MRPLRESTIEDEWQNHINRSWNLPCDEWEKMMKARALGNEDEAKDLKCTVLDYYDNLLEDLKKELVSQGYRKDIVERRVEQSMGFDILRDEYILSEHLKQQGDIFPEDGIKRVEYVEQLLNGYHKADTIEALSVNKDSRIFHDLLDLLDHVKIEELSEKNHLFGILSTKKDILKRDIHDLITAILQNPLLSYLIKAPYVILSYFEGT